MYLQHIPLIILQPQGKAREIVPGQDELTHWGWDKMAAILQTIFLNAYY